MERYIAVDNVCAWPNLSKLDDDTVLAVIFNQPTHGGWEGDVECWGSSDGGRMWTLRGTPAPHEPGTNRMNVAAGLGQKNDVIVLASGWTKRNPVGQYTRPHTGNTVPLWSCWSADGGTTWTHKDTAIQPPNSGDELIPFGDIIHVDDDTLGACIYTWQNPYAPGSFFYTSTDNGLTWSLRGTIAPENANETTPVAVSDGRLLAAVRTHDDARLDMYESTDAGSSWRLMGPVTQAGQHPAHLLELSNGNILLTYGIRNKGLYGVACRQSADGGRSWDRPQLLADLTGGRIGSRAGEDGAWYEKRQDVGYPASAQLSDGAVVTAYYCNGIDHHQRYHMGVVRWMPED